MYVAYIVVGILFALGLAMSGRSKLVKEERIVKGMAAVGVPESWFPLLASAELAGALGLLIGIFWAPLGIAAAIGTVLYFLGAIGFHLRASDFKGLPPAALMLVFGVLALIFRLASL
jgi:hypothetical protein